MRTTSKMQEENWERGFPVLGHVFGWIQLLGDIHLDFYESSHCFAYKSHFLYGTILFGAGRFFLCFFNSDFSVDILFVCQRELYGKCYIFCFLFPLKVSYSWLGTADVKIGNLLYYLQYYALSQLRFWDTGVEVGAKKHYYWDFSTFTFVTCYFFCTLMYTHRLCPILRPLPPPQVV